VNTASGQAIRTVSIVGARPQFVKLAPVSRAMRNARRTFVDRIVHTGQHYDDSMSAIFFTELEIPQPSVNLGIGSGPQGQQTGRMLEKIEEYLVRDPPDVVIVYGDTNSTLAGALAASKLHIPVAHVEAGLRSFNRRMPEELNRIVTDHVSSLLLAPTRTAVHNLRTEGLGERTLLTGDVMYDAVLFNAHRAQAKSTVLRDLKLKSGSFAVATIHRAENTAAGDLETLLRAINQAATDYGRIVFPMHPRTAAVLREQVAWQPAANLSVIDPLGYLDMLALLQGARWVLTDSGGLQKEAYFVSCPCITLRDETEWIETLDGANAIAGRDGARLPQLLRDLSQRPLRHIEQGPTPVDGPFGAGDAAHRIVHAICDLCETRQ
jgi:UDP-GlcNAc3NAcA epimerase